MTEEKPLDPIRHLILQRMRERRLSLADLSRMIGRNAAYMHQFTYRGSPKNLPDGTRRALAQILDLPEAALSGETPAAAAAAAVWTAPASMTAWPARDVPVLQLGDKTSANPTEWTSRPPTLAAVTGAFAVWVSTATGRLRPGDLAFAHPVQPARPGDVVVVIESDQLSALGELASQDGNEIVVIAHGNKAVDRSRMRLCKIVQLVMA